MPTRWPIDVPSAGKDLLAWRENIFLPVLFKQRGSFIEFVP